MQRTALAMDPQEARTQSLAAYHRSRNERTREALILACMPLARTTARRIAADASPEQLDDLIGEAAIAVIEAVDRYDADVGSFEARIRFLVRARVLEAMRRDDPRSRGIQKRASELLKSDSHSPEDAHDLILLTLPLRLSFTVPIEVLEDASLPDSAPTPEELVLERDRRRLLLAVMADLTPREALCLKLRYFDEKSFPKIGLVLNVATARAREIHGQAMRKLRSRMQESPPLARLLSERD